MIIEPKPEFQSLSEDDVRAALADPDPKNPIAIEITRLVAGYAENFQRFVVRLGYLPSKFLRRKPRCPMEAVAMQLMTEIIRDAITCAKD